MRWLALVFLVAAACGGKPTPPRPPGIPPDPDDPNDTRALRDDLEATIRESMIALSNDYDDQYLDGLVRDPRLTLIDVNPRDVVLGFDVAACRIRRLFPDRVHLVDVQDLDVVLGADRSAAWVFAHLSYRVLVDGRRATIPLRSTALFERKEGRWLKLMEHVSYGVSDVRALADAAAGKAASPRDIRDVGVTGPDADEIRRVIEVSLAGGDPALALVSTEAGALLLGSDPVRELRGPEIARVISPAGLYAGSTVTPGPIRVELTEKQTVGLAASNLTVGGRGFSLGLRATWVLEKVAGKWRIAQTHVSVPVPRAKLALEVFGEPELDLGHEER